MQITEQQARALCEAAGWEFAQVVRDRLYYGRVNPQAGRVLNLSDDADTARLRDAVAKHQGWDWSECFFDGRYYATHGPCENDQPGETLAQARIAALVEAVGG